MDGGQEIPAVRAPIVRACEPIVPAHSRTATDDFRIARPNLRVTIVRTKLIVSTALAASIIGFFILDVDIGQIAVMLIFGIIGVGMIRGT
jgi:hypothetical protein